MANTSKRILSARAAVRYLGSAAEHPMNDDMLRQILWLTFIEARVSASSGDIDAAMGQFRAMEALLWWDHDEVQNARAADAEPLDDDSFTEAFLWLLCKRTGEAWTLDAFDRPTPGTDPLARRISVSTTKSTKTALVFDHMTALATLARGPITSTPAPFFAHVMRSRTARTCSIGSTADSALYARAVELGRLLSWALNATWRAGELTGGGGLCVYDGPEGERVVLGVDRAEKALRTLGSKQTEGAEADARQITELLAMFVEAKGTYPTRRGVVLGALFEGEAVHALTIPERSTVAP